MARPSTAARRYAEAAFEIARRDGTLERWSDDLRLAADVVTQPDAARVVDNPAIPFGTRREILGKLLGDRVTPGAYNLILLLAERGRLSAAPAVAAEYKRLVDRERGVVVATVASAVPLETAELEAIGVRVREMTGARAEIVTAIDPDLIGGVTVRIGDRLIDASVRGRLERLRDRIVVGAR
ncbi:MAG TPA: F0F1 ATP synthase subunit delta [Candidatus Nanopelagicales bacterium]|nr:F0F1 ATP synthase subunit delta [Candidatus Nanopelagicales bacterium]